MDPVRIAQQAGNQAQRQQAADRRGARTIVAPARTLPHRDDAREYMVLQLQYPTRGDSSSGYLQPVWDWPRFHNT